MRATPATVVPAKQIGKSWQGAKRMYSAESSGAGAEIFVPQMAARVRWRTHHVVELCSDI